MVDKAQTIPVGKVGETISTLKKQEMIQVSRKLTLFLGIG